MLYVDGRESKQGLGKTREVEWVTGDSVRTVAEWKGSYAPPQRGRRALCRSFYNCNIS
jgi:hypothetical protein